jgi:hypothetical protein
MDASVASAMTALPPGQGTLFFQSAGTAEL